MSKKLNGSKPRLHQELFSEQRIALMRETKHHPKLIELLIPLDQNDFPEVIAEIAAYCNIALDGMYYQEELDNLCVLLQDELESYRRQILINPFKH